jgi:hypothetical protein
VALPLRRQIVIFNIVIMSPVLAVMAWAGHETYQEQIQLLREETRALAAAVVVYLERGLDLKALQTVIEDIPLPDGSVITVTDERSTVLVRSVDAHQYVGLPTTPTPVRLEAVPTSNLILGVDGVERVFANDIYDSGPYLVSVGIPTAVAYHRVAPIF